MSGLKNRKPVMVLRLVSGRIVERRYSVTAWNQAEAEQLATRCALREFGKSIASIDYCGKNIGTI